MIFMSTLNPLAFKKKRKRKKGGGGGGGGGDDGGGFSLMFDHSFPGSALFFFFLKWRLARIH